MTRTVFFFLDRVLSCGSDVLFLSTDQQELAIFFGLCMTLGSARFAALSACRKKIFRADRKGRGHRGELPAPPLRVGIFYFRGRLMAILRL
jgi:hypothetical protein